MKLTAFFCCLALSISLKAQKKTTYHGNSSATHQELIQAYEKLAKKHPEARLENYGTTDSGRPLHLFVIDPSKKFDKKDKTVILINNAIHPGEPCGVEASLLLSQDILHKNKRLKQLDDLVICIIPMYNIGGALNRSCCTRANQNGPEQQGFRGNARHLDLNRDFIKMDSKNSFAFSHIYQDWDPDIFIDTHTSNGADYQYTMTLITSQKDKLQKDLAAFVREDTDPSLYKSMESSYPMVPYVHTMGRTPRTGIQDYLETPRYSTGYAALFHSIAFVTEAHMFKSYEDRVNATYEFLFQTIEYGRKKHDKIETTRKKAKENSLTQKWFPIQWELDTTRFETISFKGYQEHFTESKLTGLQRLYYDRKQPVTYDIPYFNRYLATDSVTAPEAYVIPQAWREVIERLQSNQIEMMQLQKDTVIEVHSYYIDALESRTRPYEGHFYHSNFKTTKKKNQIQYLKGDWIIPSQQEKKRFIIEVLEPKAVDSYFRWNFFDEILQQKEWFSDYIFEEKAIEILANNPQLKASFEKKQKEDKTFRESHWQQLYYIYKHSEYYEEEHMRYPVGRIE